MVLNTVLTSLILSVKYKMLHTYTNVTFTLNLKQNSDILLVPIFVVFIHISAFQDKETYSRNKICAHFCKNLADLEQKLNKELDCLLVKSGIVY